MQALVPSSEAARLVLHHYRPEIFTVVRILVIQHSDRDNPGLLLDLQADVVVHRADFDPEVPSIDGFDGLIVLGGPPNPTQDEGFPSRRAELALIESAIGRDLPILTICLGAQLLALATGGSVYMREVAEIGWHPITLTEAAQGDLLFGDAPRTFSPMHSHFLSFELPPGAVLLGSSDECEAQIYRLGDRMWGTQFHFEMKKLNPPLVRTGYVDPRIPALAGEGSAEALAELQPISREIFDNFLRLVEQLSGETELEDLAS